ncbi:MAG TPA: non-canonical purine NTP pyrophosphatase [Dysgonomonas sp.]|nr:non-canonical purine NTP pyrophosphatase [Dysgonomonas sp.]
MGTRRKKIVFATNNAHKLEEVQAMLGEYYQVLSLQDLGENTDIPETGTTLEENAMIKADYLWKKYRQNCFADDTGLEVEALNNAPGVYSARYAGEQKSSADNVKKLLNELQGKDNRNARFRTVIALIQDGKRYQFEGIVNGVITEIPAGESGFGYDPVFQPDGYQETFAELGLDIKNKISHRAKAVEQLALFLRRK